MKRVKWILITLLILNVGITMAQKKDSLRSSSHHHRMGSMYGIPNLTEDQKKKLAELKTPHAKEVLPLKNQLAEKKAHLKTLQTAEKADLNAINSTIDEMSQLQSQIMKKNAAHKQAIRKILTDEQRIAFDTRASAGRKFHQHGQYKGMHGERGDRKRG
ncbi:MAG TPA: periplasmic heavy metal sensor [Cyclobacteriaceae bacterium]|jgi:Spy/CpxP family protein refolding chaperone|nr:periplasmic heavy metal sensor [Cyclobacteriaceae bacterium]